MKQETRILYIAPYSKQAYGAEQQDIEWGLKVLSELKNVKVFTFNLDLNEKKFKNIDFFFKTLMRTKIQYAIKYFFIYIFAFDNSMRQAFTYNNYLFISQFVNLQKIEVIVTNTSSTLLFGIQKNIKHLHRSISFEPLYVGKVINNKLKVYAHSFLKYISLSQEFKANAILVISPRDLRYYSKARLHLPLNKLIVVPLRQSAQEINLKENLFIGSKIQIGFLGSTYNVLHNRRSFDFVLDELSPLVEGHKDINLNIYGRKIVTSDSVPLNVKIHNWIDDINDIYSLNNCFIVPYFLGSGMQSKVFEPLLHGKILICDPRVLAEYNFEPYEHYLPAATVFEFSEAILWVKRNKVSAVEIGKKAQTRAQQLIGSKVIRSQIKLALELVMMSKR
jgi:hypothetical protein